MAENEFTAPDHRNRNADDIISTDVHFDSVGYNHRALSWLDLAKRCRNVCALQYAAHDVRQGHEQLFFEELVMSVGSELDRAEYEKCKGNATKLNKFIRRLSPDYERLVLFTRAIASFDPTLPKIEGWNHKELMKGWAKVSNYLHWAGGPAETVESDDWLTHGIDTVEAVALKTWNKKLAGHTAVMMPKDMEPEIRASWHRFKNGEIDEASVGRIADIALPILRNRMRSRA